tara:strand:- start:936 stop:1370 length:435 start_codon:yes stop_codon:yes gene_type:complete
MPYKEFFVCVLLLLGGLNAQFAKSESYGESGCGGELNITPPKIGSQIYATIPSIQRGSINSVYMGVSLIEFYYPITPDCALLVYPMMGWVYTLPHTVRGPNGFYLGPIPFDPKLIGLVFFVQAAYANLDLTLIWTNGVKCTVGM